MSDVGRVLAQLASRVNADAALVHSGRRASLAFLLEAGDRPFLIVLERGRITEVAEGPFVMRSWSFAIRAPERAWREFTRPYPAPGYHDIFAMNRFGHCRIEGDTDMLLPHLPHVKAVLSRMRGEAS